MKYWIEVSSYYRFELKLQEKQGLYAPSQSRHKNMLRGIRKGDIVLHYIVGGGSSEDHKSSIAGVSLIESAPYDSQTRITAKLKDVQRLLIPVKYEEIKNLKKKSTLLNKIIRINFQLYIAEIDQDDAQAIISIHPENKDLLRKLVP